MSAWIPAGAVLVLDFDGVLCDSMRECRKVARGGWTGAPPEAFLDDGLVPAAVAERFGLMRPYMRHLGHFLVALLDGPVPADADAFEARFASLAPGDADAFAERADAYRTVVRDRFRAQWLEHHELYEGVGGHVAGAYIATARDRASVLEILGARGLAPDGSRIFDRLRDKRPALARIAEREGVAPAAVVLVDDSVANCVAAKDAGFGARWASWGYCDPRDAAIAEAHEIPALTLDDVPAPRPM